MGVVYRARRSDQQFERVAAIKLLNNPLASDDARRRFFAERQILADLNHPNIAQLLDGGTTEEGIPYLVMEFIDGQPIDAYCRDADLSIAARLRLFIRVCDAVQYAHQHLIVHRDIKASNILVAQDGIPKLLDFGIAKLLEGGSAGACPPISPWPMRACSRHAMRVRNRYVVLRSPRPATSTVSACCCMNC